MANKTGRNKKNNERDNNNKDQTAQNNTSERNKATSARDNNLLSRSSSETLAIAERCMSRADCGLTPHGYLNVEGNMASAQYGWNAHAFGLDIVTMGAV